MPDSTLSSNLSHKSLTFRTARVPLAPASCHGGGSSGVPGELGASCKAHGDKFAGRRMAFVKVSAARSGMRTTAQSPGGICIGVVWGGGPSLWEGLVAASGGAQSGLDRGSQLPHYPVLLLFQGPRGRGWSGLARAKVMPLASLALGGVAFFCSFSPIHFITSLL